MATRVFAAELREQGFVVVALSPGWVATDMGSRGGRTAPLAPRQGVAGMLECVRSKLRHSQGLGLKRREGARVLRPTLAAEVRSQARASPRAAGGAVAGAPAAPGSPVNDSALPPGDARLPRRAGRARGRAARPAEAGSGSLARRGGRVRSRASAAKTSRVTGRAAAPERARVAGRVFRARYRPRRAPIAPRP